LKRYIKSTPIKGVTSTS